MDIITNSGAVVTLAHGTYTEFDVIAPFTLPAPPGGLPVPLAPGQTVKFDGRNLEYPGSPPQPVPQFLGAIKADWVVPAGSGRGPSAPRSANISVRAAETGNPMEAKPKTVVTTAYAEEQDVASVRQHASQVQTNNGTSRRVVMAEDQEGVAVRSLRTPAKMKDTLDGYNSGTVIRAAKSVQVTPGKGKSREEVLAAMTPEQREQYLNELAARKAAHGIVDDVGQGQVVARLNSQQGHQEKEGISTTLSVGGGTEIADVGGTGAPAEVTTTIVEGIKVTNTNGPKKGQAAVKEGSAPTSADPRRVIAKAVCPDFPDNYDFDAPLKKKIARIQADYEDRADVIRAVAAAETDPGVRQKLLEEFPEAFG